jgi:transposase-like protein
MKGEKMLTELTQQFDVHLNQIKQWKEQLLKGATGVFGGEVKAEATSAIDLKCLYAKIGRLHVATLMRKMGIKAICRRPNTSKPKRATRCSHNCFASCRRRDRTRFRRWTSRISPWRAALSIWPPSSTGSAGGSWPGSSPSPWTVKGLGDPKQLFKQTALLL